MKIKNIVLRKIFDSRAQGTLEVVMIDEETNYVLSEVAQGKSKGSNEIISVDYDRALKSLNEAILPQVLNKDFNSIQEFDNYLIGLDGTKNKSNLGGNLILGCSISFSRLIALKEKKELWQILRQQFFNEEGKVVSIPCIFSNFIEGGVHALDNLAFQEYLLVGKTDKNINQTIENIIFLYDRLNLYLKTKYSSNCVILGDEAGFSSNFNNSIEPISILDKIVKESHLEEHFKLAIDMASNAFYKDGFYIIDNKRYSLDNLLNYYYQLFNQHQSLMSIEDPFEEKDFTSFKSLKEILSDDKLIVGDDICTTNPELITKACKENSINAVIIKPNQIGTITETAISIKLAKQYKIKTIVSHRSGETEDNFIVHLAKAANAYGIKIGAPQRERIMKFNEMLRLYS